MNPTRLLSIALFAVFLTGCSFSLAADVTPPPGYQSPPELSIEPTDTRSPLFPIVQPDLVKGEAIYGQKCAPCHGTTGLGDGPQGLELPNPVPAIGSVQLARKAKPAQWYGIVTQGNLERFMPPFSSLTDRQRWDVVSYVVSMSTPSDEVAEGKDLFQQNCASCHGAAGKGDGPEGGANLPDFSNQEYQAGRSAEEMFSTISNGTVSKMPAFSDQLNEEEIWALTSAIRSFGVKSAGDLAQEEPVATRDSTSNLDNQPVEVITSTETLSQTTSIGSITGTVINETGGELPADLEVNLHGFDHTSITITDTVTIKNDGTYVFENVDMPDGRIFLISTQFDGVTYASEAAAVENNDRVLDLPIHVFESSSDVSLLKVDRLHYFFEPIDDTLMRVVELFVISNPSGKTLVPSNKDQPLLSFKIPTDAQNLQIQDGELGKRFISTEDGFGDTNPIRPGEGIYQLLFSYELPFKRALEFLRPVDLPINAVVILVPENGITIKGDEIQDGGIREVQGIAYHLYNRNGILPGNDLKLTINRSKQFLPSVKNSNLVFGLAALGVVLVISGIWLFQQNKNTPRDSQEMEGVPSAVAGLNNQESVMDAILALDDLYQAGKLPEDAYQKRRSELKDRLQELVDNNK